MPGTTRSRLIRRCPRGTRSTGSPRTTSALRRRRRCAATSPQGRFADERRARSTARVLESAEAHGKHLFLGFGPDRLRARPPRPVRQVRLRHGARPSRRAGRCGCGWPAPTHYADLRGPTACELITGAEKQARSTTGSVPTRCAPTPTRSAPGAGSAAQPHPLAALLMDQKVIAGVGNVYRAEVLFRHGIDPLPARAAALRRGAVGRDLGRPGGPDARGRAAQPHRHRAPGAHPEAMGRPPRVDDHGGEVYVYRRAGQPCLVCGTRGPHRRARRRATSSGAPPASPPRTDAAHTPAARGSPPRRGTAAADSLGGGLPARWARGAARGRPGDQGASRPANGQREAPARLQKPCGSRGRRHRRRPPPPPRSAPCRSSRTRPARASARQRGAAQVGRPQLPSRTAPARPRPWSARTRHPWRRRRAASGPAFHGQNGSETSSTTSSGRRVGASRQGRAHLDRAQQQTCLCSRTPQRRDVVDQVQHRVVGRTVAGGDTAGEVDAEQEAPQRRVGAPDPVPPGRAAAPCPSGPAAFQAGFTA